MRLTLLPNLTVATALSILLFLFLFLSDAIEILLDVC